MKRPLRIVLICQQDLGGTPHPVPAYRFWRTYFVSALREAGHEVLEIPACDWAGGLLARPAEEARAWRGSIWGKACDWLKAEHARQRIDCCLSYLYPQQILPPAIAEIRSLGVPCINFFCDNVREFIRVPEEFSPFDLHWVPEMKALPLYAKAGLNVLHAPMPCWIPPHLRTLPDREESAVVFVGTRDETRALLFAEVIRLGLVPRLVGQGWMQPATNCAAAPRRSRWQQLTGQAAFVRQHGLGALARKLVAKTHSSSREEFDFAPYAHPAADEAGYWNWLRHSAVCLGVNRYPSPRHNPARPDTYSRLRDIEAPMAGACYLAEWTAGLDELYDLGEEIETYRSPAELVEKSRELCADAGRRERLRRNGQRRALRDHTIGTTIGRIATALDL